MATEYIGDIVRQEKVTERIRGAKSMLWIAAIKLHRLFVLCQL